MVMSCTGRNPQYPKELELDILRHDFALSPRSWRASKNCSNELSKLTE